MSRDRRVTEWMGDVARLRALLKDNNIQQDRYDNTIWKELKNSREIENLEAQGTNTFPAMLQDFWAAFYKAAPELEDEKAINKPHQVNRPFVQKLLEDHNTKEARITTMLDEMSAAVATVHAGQTMLQEMENNPELGEAMRIAQYGQNKLAAGDEKAGGEAVKEAKEKINGAATQVRKAVKASIKAGQEKAEEVQQTMAGWGLEPGDVKHMPIGDRLELAEAITQRRLRKVADLVGRMRNLARAKQRSKVKQRRDEIHSITIGSALQHTLPQELSALTHPTRKLDFYKRFTEGQLLQYDLRGDEKLARGPIVAMIDISGSMTGEPIEWAVAIALALADMANRQKRLYRAIFFDTEVQAEFDFVPGEKNVEDFLKMARIGVGGGTNYTPALKRATQLIADGKSQNKAYEKADMIMITDGYCALDPDHVTSLIEWKERNKISCYTILIGEDSLGDLKAWNNKVWRLLNLEESGDDVAGDLFEEI